MIVASIGTAGEVSTGEMAPPLVEDQKSCYTSPYQESQCKVEVTTSMLDQTFTPLHLVVYRLVLWVLNAHHYSYSAAFGYRLGTLPKYLNQRNHPIIQWTQRGSIVNCQTKMLCRSGIISFCFISSSIARALSTYTSSRNAPPVRVEFPQVHHIWKVLWGDMHTEIETNLLNAQRKRLIGDRSSTKS